jgi:hypothetical protein
MNTFQRIIVCVVGMLACHALMAFPVMMLWNQLFHDAGILGTQLPALGYVSAFALITLIGGVSHIVSYSSRLRAGMTDHDTDRWQARRLDIYPGSFNDAPEPKPKPCRSCDGDGHVNGQECPDCEGSGK